jgi:hypothetical protein
MARAWVVNEETADPDNLDTVAIVLVMNGTQFATMRAALNLVHDLGNAEIRRDVTPLLSDLNAHLHSI